MANFDPDAFMQQTFEEEMSTTPMLIPPGDYEAVIERVGQPRRVKDRATGEEREDALQLALTWELLDEQLKSDLDRTKVTVNQYLFIELDEHGRLASGDKNWRLGQVREAVGQLKTPWNPSMLEGAGPAIVRVGHNTYEGNTSARVDRVVGIK